MPLTVASLPVLLVRVDDATSALPLRSIVETVRIEPREAHRSDTGEMLRLRDRIFPLFRLGGVLHSVRNGRDGSQFLRVVIIGIADRQIGVVVDQLLGQKQIVIKPLPSFLRAVLGLVGAIIRGDGSVCMILDPDGLAALGDKCNGENKLIR